MHTDGLLGSAGASAAAAIPVASFAARLAARSRPIGTDRRRGLWLTFLRCSAEVATASAATDRSTSTISPTSTPLARVGPERCASAPVTRRGAAGPGAGSPTADRSRRRVRRPGRAAGQALLRPPDGAASARWRVVSLLARPTSRCLLPMVGHGAYARAHAGQPGAAGTPRSPPGGSEESAGALGSGRVVNRTRSGRITGIFTGNRELTGLLSAVDLLGVDTDAAALRAGLKQMFEQPRPATGGYGR